MIGIEAVELVVVVVVMVVVVVDVVVVVVDPGVVDVDPEVVVAFGNSGRRVYVYLSISPLDPFPLIIIPLF